jgi:hypothetical protein
MIYGSWLLDGCERRQSRPAKWVVGALCRQLWLAKHTLAAAIRVR